MMRMVAITLVALLGVAARAQSEGAVSEAVPQAEAAPGQAENSAPRQEPPSTTAGVRIITRPQEPAAAKETAPAAPPVLQGIEAPSAGAPAERYRFERVGDRFLRLDNQSGQVALCTQQATGWDCRVVPEHPAMLETEIAQLRSDMEDLKQRNAVGDLDQLRTEVEGLKQLPRQLDELKQAEVPNVKQLQAEIENLKQLRTEVENLKRLRNEVEDLKQLQGEAGDLKDLRTTVNGLKNEVAALRPPSVSKAIPGQENPPRPPETVPPAGSPNAGAHLSPREDIDRAAAFVSDAWRRLVDMISNLQKEAMRRN